jgi:predicted glutamine amidotransferase
MCRLFFSYQTRNTKQKMIDFLGQSTQRKKNTPGSDNNRDHINHKDGFGFAWLEHSKWKIYKQPFLWSKDSNIENKMNRINKTIVIGHLRKIHENIVGERKEQNTHPFIYENQILIHNGFIKNYSKHREMFVGFIDDEYKSKIGGETDTEVLFFMLLTLIKRHKLNKKTLKMEQIQLVFVELFHYFEANKIELTANFIFANEKYVVITRYLFYNPKEYHEAQYPPSLYYSLENGLLVVSEPVTDDYRPFPMNTMMVLDYHSNKLIHGVITPL